MITSHTLNLAMIEISNWFQCNRLTLNYDKTHFLQFLTKKQNEIQQQIVTSNSVISNINCTNFLGLMIDSTLSWKDHTIEITPNLNKACYVIRTLTFLRSPEIFLTSTLLCHTALYFVAIPIIVLIYLKFKNG